MGKTVLVTGVGGNVGQGVVRNIKNSGYDVRVVGTNTEAVSGGNHLCNKVYQVPFSSSPDYISDMVRICVNEKVDLIIPCTDYETYYLAKEHKSLPVLSSSDAKVSYIFLNKYHTWMEFRKYEIPFAETFLPSMYNNEFKETIVKPAEGRGSRDIHLNPPDMLSFSDDFIVQKLYKGAEITTAFYVTKKKKLLGLITLRRTLSQGTTTACEVVFDYDKKIMEIITEIIRHFNVKGSCNIQSIVVKNGEIVPFEVNGRISGTNSIRSQFGFDDVKYTLQEHLYNEQPLKPIVKKGSAVRLYMDVIYPGINLNEIKDKTTKHYIY